VNANLQALLDAMNQNLSVRDDENNPYKCVQITETRRKYHLLDYNTKNGQTTACFLIDIATEIVYKADGYGRKGRRVGTVASITADYLQANRSVAAYKKAREFGRKAFEDGLNCVPALDAAFNEFMHEAVAADESGSGTKPVLQLLNGWHRGYSEANAAAPVIFPVTVQ
jgi:hypothetical protein